MELSDFMKVWEWASQRMCGEKYGVSERGKGRGGEWKRTVTSFSLLSVDSRHQQKYEQMSHTIIYLRGVYSILAVNPNLSTNILIVFRADSVWC